MSEESGDCGALKRGVIDLRCSLDAGHDGPHEAAMHDTRIIEYPNAQHKVSITEEVTWLGDADGLHSASVDAARKYRKERDNLRQLLDEATRTRHDPEAASIRQRGGLEPVADDGGTVAL